MICCKLLILHMFVEIKHSCPFSFSESTRSFDNAFFSRHLKYLIKTISSHSKRKSITGKCGFKNYLCFNLSSLRLFMFMQSKRLSNILQYIAVLTASGSQSFLPWKQRHSAPVLHFHCHFRG